MEEDTQLVAALVICAEAHEVQQRLDRFRRTGVRDVPLWRVSTPALDIDAQIRDTSVNQGRVRQIVHARAGNVSLPAKMRVGRVVAFAILRDGAPAGTLGSPQAPQRAVSLGTDLGHDLGGLVGGDDVVAEALRVRWDFRAKPFEIAMVGGVTRRRLIVGIADALAERATELEKDWKEYRLVAALQSVKKKSPWRLLVQT